MHKFPCPPFCFECASSDLALALPAVLTTLKMTEQISVSGILDLAQMHHLYSNCPGHLIYITRCRPWCWNQQTGLSTVVTEPSNIDCWYMNAVAKGGMMFGFVT